MTLEIDLFGVVDRPPRPRFLAVDFFCGAGGTTRGLIDAGGYVIAGVDKETKCRDTFVLNNRNESYRGDRPLFLDRDIFPKTKAYPEGQQELLGVELSIAIEAAKIDNPGVPLLFAICAPCQPFTGLARKAIGEGRVAARIRDRNLLLEGARMVERFTPDIVISENVAGIQEDRYGRVWGEFEDKLSELGYVVGSKVVSTENFGIAQVRRRSILVAVRKALVPAKVVASGAIEIPEADPAAAKVTVRDVLEKYPPLAAGETHPDIPNHAAAGLTEINLRRISLAAPGATNEYLWEHNLELACHARAKERTGGTHRTFTDVYTRMAPDRPAPTITTNCNSISNGRFGHYDPSQNRAISLREAAALQSFRDDYVFHPRKNAAAVARQIGNAVPPKLSEYFARFALNMAGSGRA